MCMMDILSHSKKTALDNKVDIAYYIINYIDHELITFNLINQFDRECIDTKIDTDGIITVTFKTNSTEDYEAFKSELSSLIESNPTVEVSGSFYNLALTNIENEVGVTISPLYYMIVHIEGPVE